MKSNSESSFFFLYFQSSETPLDEDEFWLLDDFSDVPDLLDYSYVAVPSDELSDATPFPVLAIEFSSPSVLSFPTPSYFYTITFLSSSSSSPSASLQELPDMVWSVYLSGATRVVSFALAQFVVYGAVRAVHLALVQTAVSGAMRAVCVVLTQAAVSVVVKAGGPVALKGLCGGVGDQREVRGEGVVWIKDCAKKKLLFFFFFGFKNLPLLALQMNVTISVHMLM